MAVKKAEVGVSVELLQREEITFRIIGETPLYFNAMSNKAKLSLLAGGGKKTAAEKKDIKHNPEQEFVDSCYFSAEDAPTLLGFPVTAFKGAMAVAALETAGVSKTSVNRLVFVKGEMAPIYGLPRLKMDVVRSADMNRTPDIRTRAFLPRWATEITVSYIRPTLSDYAIAAMLTNAGSICGVGDFRQEKGKGNYGLFKVHGTDMDKTTKAIWDKIVKEGRAGQAHALENPVLADAETENLMKMLAVRRSQKV